MTPREIVQRAVRFEHPPRLPRELPEPYGNDFVWTSMSPHPDSRPPSGTDEWGAVWHNLGTTGLGEVLDFPLKDWSQWDTFRIPDIRRPDRWQSLAGARERAGDCFLLGTGISLYERVHFIRGLENTWTDIYEHPDELGALLDVLVEMNLYTIDRYAEAGVDGLMWPDDWGLQHRLMIRPDDWRRLWLPRYQRVYQAARDAGLLTFLHSCGYITDILDDLIDCGLQVVQMDQQVNMGVEELGRRFAGRITFWCPVDIQAVMPSAEPDEIRDYVQRLITHLGRPDGGFIAKWYPDPKSVGHTAEAIAAQCDAFLELDPHVQAAVV